MSAIETAVRAQQTQVYLAEKSQVSGQTIAKRGYLLALSQDDRIDLFGRDFYSAKAENPVPALTRAMQRVDKPYVAAVIYKEQLYLTNRGNCHAYLIRDNGARRLTGNIVGIYLPITLQKGDIVLLCAGSACQTLAKVRIKVRGLSRTAQQIVNHALKSGNGADGVVLAQLRKSPPLSIPQRAILAVLSVVALIQFIMLMILNVGA